MSVMKGAAVTTISDYERRIETLRRQNEDIRRQRDTLIFAGVFFLLCQGGAVSLAVLHYLVR